MYIWSPLLLKKPSIWPDYISITGYWFLDGEKDYKPEEKLVEFLKKGRISLFRDFNQNYCKNYHEIYRYKKEYIDVKIDMRCRAQTYIHRFRKCQRTRSRRSDQNNRESCTRVRTEGHHGQGVSCSPWNFRKISAKFHLTVVDGETIRRTRNFPTKFCAWMAYLMIGYFPRWDFSAKFLGKFSYSQLYIYIIWKKLSILQILQIRGLFIIFHNFFPRTYRKFTEISVRSCHPPRRCRYNRRRSSCGKTYSYRSFFRRSIFLGTKSGRVMCGIATNRDKKSGSESDECDKKVGGRWRYEGESTSYRWIFLEFSSNFPTSPDRSSVFPKEIYIILEKNSVICGYFAFIATVFIEKNGFILEKRNWKKWQANTSENKTVLAELSLLFTRKSTTTVCGAAALGKSVRLSHRTHLAKLFTHSWVSWFFCNNFFCVIFLALCPQK